MDESLYMQRAKMLIEKKVDSGRIADWRNKDFIALSHDISAASRISISPDTLKRVFGRLKTYKETYTPQEETRNAIAIYLGYESWEAFKSDTKNSNFIAPVTRHPSSRRPLLSRVFLTIAAIALALLCFFLFTHRDPGPENFSFSGKNLTGYPPHTSIFNYDVSEIESDCVAIDYDWSVPMIEKLRKDDHTITTMHGEPGYYHVKLLVDNKAKSVIGVHVLTKGWAGSISTFTGISQQLDSGYIANGVLHLPEAKFRETGIDKNLVHLVRFTNYRDFNVDGDNFAFTLRAKNTKEIGGQSCYDVQIEIICENGKILTLFVEKGCHKYARFIVGDVAMEGHNRDLSAFGQILPDWATFGIRVDKKTAFLSVNDREIFSSPYNTTLGKVKGLAITFKGRGMADFVRMNDNEGNVLYYDDFEGSELSPK